MERLILLRHSKAENDSASGGDAARRLTPQGARDAQAAGDRLAELGFHADVCLVSTAARTRETWAAVQPTWPACEVRFEPGLYHAEAGEIWDQVRPLLGQGRNVMVVGHNPGLHELVLRLLIEGGASSDLLDSARSRFPTSAAAVFLIDDSGRPIFDGLLLPPGGGRD